MQYCGGSLSDANAYRADVWPVPHARPGSDAEGVLCAVCWTCWLKVRRARRCSGTLCRALFGREWEPRVYSFTG